MTVSPAPLDLRFPQPRPRRLRSASPALQLVANANASGVGSRELVSAADRLLRDYGGRVETRLTSSVEEVAALLGESNGGRRLVLLGGDGTLHALANLPGPRPEVALLPAGRANNVAHSLGIPTDLRDAARLAVRGAARPLDLIAAQSAERRYLAVEGVSVGFLALARARYRSTNSANVRAALGAGLAALARFGPLCLAVESDGAPEVTKVGQLFVANLPLYGFGLRVAPAADPDDGLLDLVAIQADDRRSLLAMLARLRRGTHLGHPGVRTWRARRVRIVTGGRSPVIADSTSLGLGPVDLSVAPAALEVVAPER